MSRPMASCGAVAEGRLGRVVPADDAAARGPSSRPRRARPRASRAAATRWRAPPSSAWRRATNWPTWLPSTRIVSSSCSSGSRSSREKNSITPTTPSRAAAAGSRTPRAGRTRRAASARGKFAVLGRVDDPGRLARLERRGPGRPSPGASVIRSLSASNSGAPSARVPGADAAQPLVVRARPPRPRRAPSRASCRSPRAPPRTPRQADRVSARIRATACSTRWRSPRVSEPCAVPGAHTDCVRHRDADRHTDRES